MEVKTEHQDHRQVVIQDLWDPQYEVFWDFETSRLCSVSRRYPLKPVQATGEAVKAGRDMMESGFDGSKFGIDVIMGERTQVKGGMRGLASEGLEAPEVMGVVESLEALEVMGAMEALSHNCRNCRSRRHRSLRRNPSSRQQCRWGPGSARFRGRRRTRTQCRLLAWKDAREGRRLGDGGEDKYVLFL